MSRSKFAIYDRTTLAKEHHLGRNHAERSITIYNNRDGSYNSREPYINWNPLDPPFPTPLIYLKQKRT